MPRLRAKKRLRPPYPLPVNPGTSRLTAALPPQTPLHLAALTGQAGLCRHLLVAGADAGLRDRHGNTALHVACSRGDRTAVQQLTAPVSAAETRQAALRYSQRPRPGPLPLDEWNYQGEYRRLTSSLLSL